MKIGVVKEIKPQEYRVGLTPGSALELIRHHGAEILVESGAGSGMRVDDKAYRDVGAVIFSTAEEVWAKADMIVKVKEPMPEEYHLIGEGQILFTFLHLAANFALTKALMDSGAWCIAYETVTDERHRLPLLSPMSRVAGRLSVIEAQHWLLKYKGGDGLLLGGVVGVPKARVVIIGAGVAGINALQIAIGLGAEVWILDRSVERLEYIDMVYGNAVRTMYSSVENIQKAMHGAQVVIGSVLIPGGAAPHVVSCEELPLLEPGAVLVDIAIDQGGCFEGSRPTTHENPTFEVDERIFYCVANMPGAVPITSTRALNNATLPYVTLLADKGLAALRENPLFLQGLNVAKGAVTYKHVATSLDLPYTDPLTLDWGEVE